MYQLKKLVFRDPMENIGYGQEESAVKEIAHAVNRGANSEVFAEELASSADTEKKKNQIISIIAVCALAHGYKWECDEKI